MSRLILKLNDDEHKTERVVVGWDRPLQSYFWQVFSPEPPTDEKGDTFYPDDWEEMEGYGGYSYGEIMNPNYLHSMRNVPDEVRELCVDEEVIGKLYELRIHEDTMYNDRIMMLGDGTEKA